MEDERVRQSSSSKIGIAIIMAKIAPKLVPIAMKLMAAMPKMFKGALSLKAVGVVASAGLYSYLMTWQMGIALTAFLFVHEYGHLWAMKKCGLKTKGIYLIPGFGGAAISEEGFRSCRNESFIALMGPLVGLFFIVPVLLLYFYNHNPLFAAIASMMAVINLINLFPINPLDGGRAVKGLLYSFHGSVGFYFGMLSFLTTIILGYSLGMGLLAYIAFLGLLETFSDYGLSKHLKKLTVTIMRLFFALIVCWLLQFDTSSRYFSYMIWFAVVVLTSTFVIQLMYQAKDEYKSAAYVPLAIVSDLFQGIKQVFQINPSQLVRADGMETMTKKGVVLYSFAYVATVLIMIGIIWFANKLPGCETAMELLK